MIVQSPLFKGNQTLTHFFTTREGGVSTGSFSSLNLSPYSGDLLSNVNENTRRLKQFLQLSDIPFVIPRQNHGTEVRVIDQHLFDLSELEREEFLSGVDALVTSEPQICIAVTTADCVPLIIYDPNKKAVAVVHAGWKGTCAGIVKKTLMRMQAEFGCQSSDLQVVIGPSISLQSYNVGEELVDKFQEAGFPVEKIFHRKDQMLFLDLWGANAWQLTSNGVLQSNIHSMEICTYIQEERFFSARRLGIQSGRILSGVLLNK